MISPSCTWLSHKSGRKCSKIVWRNRLEIDEKFCPECKNKNERSAIICRYCGAAMDIFRSGLVLTSRDADEPDAAFSMSAEIHIDSSKIPEDHIAFYAEGMTQPVYLYVKKELILGREGLEVDGVFNSSSLNFSEFGDYQMGISRKHAMIRRTDSGYEIIDLVSTNGSWLDNEQLIPNKPYSLANGSKLRFGLIRLLFLYQ